ncbi:geranylgeranyl transferase type-1 subunit beta [Malassezia pachydermatis]
MTFAYFCLSGLDLLQRTDTDCQADQREAYIAWIYDQQVPTEHGGGFRGSPTSSSAHIVMTYTALLCLSILRDDFARLDREGLRRHVHQLQKPDGSFLCAHGSREQDVRFSYAAFAIAYMLNDWSIMDCELAMTYMLRCQVRARSSYS